MAEGQLASLSWHKTLIWCLQPDLYYCLTVTVLLLVGTLSDKRMGLSPAYAAGPRQRNPSQVETLGTRDHISLSQI
jgi:hypothetical protein